MIFPLIMFGEVIFWIICSVSLFAVCGSFYKKSLPVALGTITLVFLSFLLLGSADLRAHFDMGLTSWLVLSGVYVVVAVLWAFLKWFRVSLKCAEEYGEWKEKWLKDNGGLSSIDELDTVSLKKFFKYIFERESRESDTDYLNRPMYSYHHSDGLTDAQIKQNAKLRIYPSPKRNKELIGIWMALWPISMVTTFLGDILYDFWQWLIKLTTKVFIRLSNFALRKHASDFA